MSALLSAFLLMSILLGERLKTWQVYLLRCADDTLYCGITNDVSKRLRQHNGELKGGAKYTQPRRPCVLVYSEACENRSMASQREHVIKKLSRQQKQALCESGLGH